jgi:hypothetical protein
LARNGYESINRPKEAWEKGGFSHIGKEGEIAK